MATEKAKHGKGELPDEWEQDLQRDNMTRGHEGGVEANPQAERRTAHDMKDIHRVHPGLSKDELKRILVLAEGTRLEQGAKYFDLLHPGRGEFVATAEMTVGADHWFVQKSEVDYPLWNRIIGVTNPDRLDIASDQQ